jgi:hypothetical protein
MILRYLDRLLRLKIAHRTEARLGTDRQERCVGFARGLGLNRRTQMVIQLTREVSSFGLRAFGEREQVVRLLAIRFRLEILVAETADGNDDPDGVSIRRFHPEIPLTCLDQDNRLVLRYPPPPTRGATHMGNPLVRVVTVALVDAVDLSGLRLGDRIHNISPVCVRQA